MKHALCPSEDTHPDNLVGESCESDLDIDFASFVEEEDE